MELSKFQAWIRNDPEDAIKEMLGPQYLWAMQVQIVRDVFTHERVAIGGCVSSSKTYAAAMAALMWLLAAYPSRAFTFAPTGRQVDINLWGDIRKVYREARKPLGGKIMPKESRLDFGPDWYALGFATDEPANVHGIHGPNDLLILDDAHGVKKEMTDEIENATASGAHVLYLFNPVVVSGEVYDVATGKAGATCRDDSCRGCKNTKVRMISAFDTPNVKAGKEVIPGMITIEAVQRWARKFGESSNFYRSKVLALWPASEPDTLIPLDWVELAFTRKLRQESGVLNLGVDVARFGDDNSVIQPMIGLRAIQNTVYQGLRTTELAGHGIRIKKELMRSDPRCMAPGFFYVDDCGIGGGVTDNLVEEGEDTIAIDVAEAPSNPEEFENKRSEQWWNLREALDPKGVCPIALDRNDELAGEICSVKFTVSRKGKIRVEEKQETKKRLGHSPDQADALVNAVNGVRNPSSPVSEWPQSERPSGGAQKNKTRETPDWA